ncbi:MAG: hypothetical protein ABI629_18510 [bacterium]
MRHRFSVIAAGALAACCVGLAACDKKEAPPAAPVPAAQAPALPAFAIASVDLGKQVGADKKVTAPASEFGQSDTIYAVVSTIGTSPKVELKARWTYEDGQLVSESTETIAPVGPLATEFHIEKASGWPVGKYTVVISANGTAVQTKQFEVK